MSRRIPLSRSSRHRLWPRAGRSPLPRSGADRRALSGSSAPRARDYGPNRSRMARATWNPSSYGQAQVDQRDDRRTRERGVDAQPAVRGHLDIVALQLQELTQHLTAVFVILDDENARARAGTELGGSAPGIRCLHEWGGEWPSPLGATPRRARGMAFGEQIAIPNPKYMWVYFKWIGHHLSAPAVNDRNVRCAHRPRV